jgi:hypothetical protein
MSKLSSAVCIGATLGAASVFAVACSHEWDGYEPRPDAAGAVGGGPGATGVTGTAGSAAEGGSGAGAASNGSNSGGGGLGGSGSGGCAPPGATGYRAAVLTDCPIAYFRMGETAGATTADEVSGLIANLTNGPSLGAPGAIAADADTAVSMDGVDDSICAGDVFDFPGGLSFTIELWISPASLDNSYRRVFAKEVGNGTPARNGYTFWARQPDPTAPSQTATGFELWLDDTKAIDTHLFEPPPLATWTHVATRLDGATQKGALFFGGVMVAEAMYTDTIVDNIGAFCWGAGSTGTANFAGSLDELAIYDHALSDARIVAHHAAGTTR